MVGRVTGSDASLSLSPRRPTPQAMAFLNDGAQYEGLVRRWNNSKVRARAWCGVVETWIV